MSKKLYFIFFFLLAPVLLSAQTKQVNPDFKNYSMYIDKIVFRGFSNATSSVNSLLQASDGYLWIGTSSGLFRYDGYHLKVFDKNSINELQSNYIRCLTEDRNGNIWIGTDKGVTVHQKNRVPDFKIIEQFRNKKIISICEDNSGSLLIGTSTGLTQFINDSIKKIDNFGNMNISEIIKDSSGNIWVSTFTKGLYKYENRNFRKILLRPNEENISTIYCDPKGIVWAGTLSGAVYKINSATGSQISVYNTGTRSPVSRIISVNNYVWLCTLGSGLYRLSNGNMTSFGKEKGLYNEMLSCLISDNENNIWIGTQGGGLFKIRNDKFGHLTEKEGLSTNFSRTVFEDKKNNIWIGNSISGVDRISPDGKIVNFGIREGLSDQTINTLCEDDKGNIWIGTENGGVNIIKDNKVEIFFNEKLNSKSIKAIFRDSRNIIWIGTSNGLLKINNDKYDYLNVESGLPHSTIHCITEDNAKNIIIGTYKGFSVYDGNKFTNYNSTNGLISDFVNCLYCDKEGVVWIGTSGGLIRFKNGKIENYTSQNGLYDDNILSIVEDNNILWMSSRKGIFYVRKNEFSIMDQKNSFLFSVGYDAEDGMASSECYGISQPAGIKIHSGFLLFPTAYGIVSLEPEHIFSLKTLAAPKVVISNFVVDNVTTNMSGNIILKPGKKSFQFDFSALSFTNPEKNHYRYMLEGYDDDWQYAGNKTHVEYTNLSPGDYTFRVMGSNSDGVWNVEGAYISFTLKPYFYQSKIFYSLSIALGVFIILGLVKLRVLRLERRKRELEKIVEIRTRELREINQTKDKLFSIISHDLRGSIGNFMSMLKLLVDEPDVVDEDELKDILKTMKVSSESTYYLLDNLLNWARSQRGVIDYKPQVQEINYIVDDVILLLNQIAKSKQINLSSNLTEPITAHFDKNTINTVIRNLTSNALKFTKANGNVKIDAEKNGNFVTISVNDDGVGISGENLSKIFNAYQGITTLGTGGEKGTGLGLMLCKEFVEKNGGKIWVESVVGKGSSFKFTLPIEAR